MQQLLDLVQVWHALLLIDKFTKLVTHEGRHVRLRNGMVTVDLLPRSVGVQRLVHLGLKSLSTLENSQEVILALIILLNIYVDAVLL